MVVAIEQLGDQLSSGQERWFDVNECQCQCLLDLVQGLLS